MVDQHIHDFQRLVTLLSLPKESPILESFITNMAVAAEVTTDTENNADDEFIEFKKLGFGLCFQSGVLQQIALHSGSDGSSYSRYQPALINGLAFGSTEIDIKGKMGAPDFEGGGNAGYFGNVLRWIKYKQGDHTVHFEFDNAANGLQTVTLSIS